MFDMVITFDDRFDFVSRHRAFETFVLPDKEEPWKRQRVPNPEARAERARRLLGRRNAR